MPICDWPASARKSSRKAQAAFAENDCKMICSNLPVYVVPEDLLKKILDRANVNTKTREDITRYWREAREALATQGAQHSMHLIVSSTDLAVGSTMASRRSVAGCTVNVGPFLFFM